MSLHRRLSGIGRAVVFGVVVVCAFCSGAFGQPWDGNGVEGDPYQIWTAEDMQAIGADANYWDAHFLLCANIDLSAYTGTSFNIIGEWNTEFTGVFDGNGHNISNFFYYDPNRGTAGIFGYTSSAFEVRDLTLTDVNVVGNYYVGSLVGLNYGKVERCSVTGVVTGTEDVGGLVGMNEEGGKIADCNSNVIMRNHGYLFAVGCLVGYNFEGDVIDCSSSGNISGGGDSYMLGGLVGFNRGRISRCYSTANASGYWYVGGLIGEHDWYDLQSCSATGDILCEASGGGLVGRNYHTIINCYAIGDVNSTSGAGGLVGNDWGGGAINCYSAGYVTGSTYVGGLVGEKDSWVCYIGCFWDVNTSGQAISAGGSGKTTAEMQSAETYSTWGCWEDWKIVDGSDYPRLIWEDGPGDPILRPSVLYAGGSGSGEDPYLIESLEQLLTLSTAWCDWDKHFKLVCDIDMGGCNGAGLDSVGVGNFPFTGIFDGDGHEIRNLCIYASGSDAFGLFGEIRGGDCLVTGVRLIDPNIEAAGSNQVGSLVGRVSYGTVSRCYSRGGSVSGNAYVGGLVGMNFMGEIVDSYAQVSVSGGESGAGGLVGFHSMGSISRSYSTGGVSAPSGYGGLVGSSYSGQVYDSFWDTQTSGCDVSNGGTGKTTVEMQTESTFTDAGWDFVGELINGPNDIWEICEGTNYPKFVWQIPVGDMVCPDGVNFEDYAYFAERWYETDYGDVNGVELTGDGRVNWEDFGLFAGWWMVSGCGECGGADFTGEGDVDYLDLDVLAGYWLESEYGDCGGAELTGDGVVGVDDLGRFTENWLEGI